MHSWELDAALDVLTMCSCHLHQSEPIMNEVVSVSFSLWSLPQGYLYGLLKGILELELMGEYKE